MNKPKFRVGQSLTVRHGSGNLLHVVVTKIITSTKKHWYEFVEKEGQFPMLLSEPVLLKILHPVLSEIVVDAVFVPTTEVGPNIVSQFDVMVS